MKKMMFVFFALWALVSCNKDDSLTMDDELKNELIGQWKFTKQENTVLTFNENNDYEEVVYYNEELYYKVTGKYRLEDGMLKFSDLKYEYHILEEGVIKGYEYWATTKKIIIEDDLLTMNDVEIYTSTEPGENNSIIGKWRTESFLLGYFPTEDTIYKSGLFVKNITFFASNSMNVENSYLISDDISNDICRYSYTFENSILKIGSYCKQYYISFDENGMSSTNLSDTYNYIKIE